MPTIIEKARKGNADAMNMLYNANKTDVMFLCKALLLDDNAASNAVSRIFKSMWELLISGQISTEEEFSATAIRKSATYCKTYLSKKNSKAFRVPANRNFTGIIGDTAKMMFSGDVCNIILQNLPPLQRFVYVLSTSFHYNTAQLAKLFNTNEDTIRSALEAENACLVRIVSAASDKMKMGINLSVDAFHDTLLAKKKIEIPKTVDSTVLIGIDNICEPIRRKEKKKVIRISAITGAVVLCICLIVGIVLATGSNSQSNSTSDEGSLNSSDINNSSLLDTDDYSTPEISISHYADIKIQDYGTITVALDAEAAPETVANFVSLAESGFYDGLTFHRIIDGFMMQGGDPNGDGSGGSSTNINGEFTDNGFENNLSHIRGAISMARSSDYNSASSQFFIVHEDSVSLDGQYAVFGYVTEGIDVVDLVCTTAEPIDDNGLIASDEQPVITSITIRSVEDDTTDSTTSDTDTTTENTISDGGAS